MYIVPFLFQSQLDHLLVFMGAPNAMATVTDARASYYKAQRLPKNGFITPSGLMEFLIALENPKWSCQHHAMLCLACLLFTSPGMIPSYLQHSHRKARVSR